MCRAMGGNRWDSVSSMVSLIPTAAFACRAHTQPVTTSCCCMLGCTATVDKQKAAEEATRAAALQKEEERKLRAASQAVAKQAELVRCKSRESFVGMPSLTWLKLQSRLHFLLTWCAPVCACVRACVLVVWFHVGFTG
jgi:hypothetical protein